MEAAIRVLYVDDESTLLDLCKTYLERLGEFAVTIVPSAPEAIRILELARFDAIISDYQMPEMDGIEFLKVIRARGNKIPFIIFTGKGREEVVIEALNSGADFYLQKGGEPKSQFAELSHKIRHAISSRQADKALFDSEKRYRTVFENTGSATVIVEENYIISLANAGFEHLSGFSKEELEGKKSWTEFVVKEDLARMQSQHNIRRADDKEKALKQYEFRFIKRSGDIRNIFLIIDIIPGTKKSVASLIDITGQKQVEETLRETNEYLHKLIDFSNTPIIIWNPDLRITRFNQASEHLTGRDEQEVIGQPVDILFPEEARDTSRALIKKTLAGKRWEAVEIPILASDGTTHTVLWNSANILTAEDELISTIVQGVDITDRKRVEEALRESESQFRALSENSQDFIMRYDKEHRHTYANPACLRVSGMTAEQFIGKTHRELGFPPDLCAIWEPAIDRVFATGQPYGETFAWTGVDGEVILDWRLFPEKDDGGRVVSVLGVSRDITDRNKADDALRESEERFKHISELIPNFAYSCKKAPNGEFAIDWITGAPEQITGYTNDKIKEMTCWKFLVIDEDIPVFEKNVTGLSPGESVRCELRIKRKDGGIMWLSSYAKCVTDQKEPGYLHLYGGCRDITMRKRAEEALRVVQEKYMKAFLSVPDAITISKLDSGRFIEVNDAATRIFGYTRNELLGKSTVELGIWRDKESRDRLIGQVRELGRVSQFEVLNWRKSGESFNAIVNADTISIGNVPYLIAVIRDVTDRKNIEAALKKSEEQYRTLAANLPDIVYRVYLKEHGRMQFFNDQITTLTGYKESELTQGTTCSIEPLIHLDDRERVVAAVEKAIAEHGTFAVEYRFLHRDGSIRTFNERGRVIFGDDSEPLYIDGMIHDITDRKNIEAALIKSEKKSRSLLENVPELILVHRNGIILYSNPAAMNSLGYQPHEVINRQVMDFIAPEFHERVAAAVRRRMSDKPVEPYEIAVIGKDGSRRTMVVNGSTIEFDGAPASLIILVDITERKKVEEELKRSEARLRAVVEDQTEFICRFTPDGKLTFVNDAYCRYFGLDRKECLAHSHLVVLPPEDARLMEKHLASLTLQNPVATIDHRIIMPSGEVRWQRWNDRAIFDGNDTVIEYQSVGRDVTEQKIVEMALHESEERFCQIAESAGEWIWEVDADGMYTYSNAMVYEILGYAPEEIIKRKHFYDFFVPEDRDQLKEGALRAFANREPFKGFVNANLHKNGDRVILETSGYPILDTDGTLAGYRGTDIDITSRKKVEEALRESERELTDIISFLPDATLVIDKNGTVLAWNRAMEKMTGVPAEQILGKAEYEYALPFYHERRPITIDLVLHDDPAVAAKYPFMKKEGDALLSEIFLPHLNEGKGAYLWFKASPLYDAAGNISGAIESIRDITDQKQAEEALRDAHEKYTKAFLSAPDAIAISELDSGRFIEVNDAATRMFGYSRDELIGKNAVELGILLNTEDREHLIDQIQKQGRVSQFELLERRKSGELYTAQINADTVSIGNVPYLITIVQDITERKRVEQEIHTLQQFQQSIIDNANVWISVLDPKGTILVWNITAEQISGYAADDAIGTNTIWKQLYPDPVYRKQVAENILDIIKKNTYVENFETRIRTKGGDEKIIWWNTQPLRDASGKPVQFITIGRDNTARKRSEESLRALRQFEESVIKNANIWISVLDGKGNVSVWNRAAEEISGYKADEVIGKNTIWSRMYPDKEYRRSVTATIKEVIGAHKYLENFETRIRTNDGQERIIWWNTRVLQDVPGIDETFIAIGKDVTEQKTLSDAVQLANKKLNLLSSITRHDILNQLLALKGYLELSGDILNDPMKMAEYIAKEQNIANTIEDQIQFTKDYQNLGVTAPTWQKVHESVEKAKQSLPLRGIAVEIDKTPLEVYADPLLMRVFYNLIDNALRYGGEQMTAIRFSSQESSRGIMIICEDDGEGVPAGKKEAIFIQGYFKHTGFGMFLSREILSITGITIAETGEPGKGARFEITVPKGMYRFTG
jgi:PAS domain S-box-containing protein